jgi:adenine-specific DNA-methyltransferase
MLTSMAAKNPGRQSAENAAQPWGPDNPHPLSRMRKELIWQGKYDEWGNRREVDVAASALPILRLECVDPPTGAATTDGFRNRLISGDNKIVMASLLAEFAGKIDLIYIDPPFDVGVDFTMALPIGDKRESADEKTAPLKLTAYRDSWGHGAESYAAVMFDRVTLAKKCLAETGSFFVHCDWRIEQVWRTLLDEVFGADHFRNQIVWTYGGSGRGAKAIAAQFPRNHDVILWYSKSDRWTYKPQYTKKAVPIEMAAKAGYQKDARGRWFKTAPRGDYTDASIAALDAEDRIYKTRNGSVRIKYFLRSDGKRVFENVMVGDAWNDIPDAMHLPEGERTDYATQKPLALLERVIASASNEGDLVADFFAGSGTTAVAAEKLGRRWIAADLGRFALHSTRKRMIATQRALRDAGKPCRGFDVLGFGVHERKRWFRETIDSTADKYRLTILDYFEAEAIKPSHSINPLIAGRRGKALVHVSEIDVVFSAVAARAVTQAAAEVGAKEVFCLVWEFETDTRQRVAELEAETGVKTHVLPLPSELMERGPNHAPPWVGVPLLEVDPVFHQLTSGSEVRAVDIKLKTFLPSQPLDKSKTALMHQPGKNAIDFIDFWAIDFDWDASKDQFNHHWQDFRTRKNRSLKTQSDAGHRYPNSGIYAVCVRVIDVFGRESSTVLNVTV